MSAWTLHDPVTTETWAMPINPNAMTSPHPRKSLKHAVGIRNAHDDIRSFKAKPAPQEWSWSGVIRTEAHYNAYVYWAEKADVVHVTDHFGRTWAVVIRKFAPTDRRPTKTVPWRMRYEITVLNLGRVS